MHAPMCACARHQLHINNPSNILVTGSVISSSDHKLRTTKRGKENFNTNATCTCSTKEDGEMPAKEVGQTPAKRKRCYLWL